jgi:hypothetical protein
MPKKWSFAEDRRFVRLARASKTLESIAKNMNWSPKSVRAKAMRLGISLKSRYKLRRKSVKLGQLAQGAALNDKPK